MWKPIFKEERRRPLVNDTQRTGVRSVPKQVHECGVRGDSAIELAASERYRQLTADVMISVPRALYRGLNEDVKEIITSMSAEQTML